MRRLAVLAVASVVVTACTGELKASQTRGDGDGPQTQIVCKGVVSYCRLVQVLPTREAPAPDGSSIPQYEDCKAKTLKAVPRPVASPAAGKVFTSAQKNGVYRMRVPGYDTAGVYVSVSNNGCPSRLRVAATMNEAVNAMEDDKEWGWGYGIGACNAWTGSDAQGLSLQHAFFRDASGTRANDSRQYLPEKNRTDMPITGTDNPGDTNVWAIRYQDGAVTLTQNDGPPMGPYPAIRGKDAKGLSVPANCRNKGVFLRVFNADVTFSDISIEQFAG